MKLSKICIKTLSILGTFLFYLIGYTAGDVDQKTVAKAFKVEVNGNFVPCISYSGGDLTGEKAEASSGSSQHNESTMGHNYITELTLVSFITPDDNTFSDAANAVANQGKNERYTITITEMAKDKSVIKDLVYDDCLLTSMDFPAVDAAGGEMLKRTTTFRPTRLTVKAASGKALKRTKNAKSNSGQLFTSSNPLNLNPAPRLILDRAPIGNGISMPTLLAGVLYPDGTSNFPMFKIISSNSTFSKISYPTLFKLATGKNLAIKEQLFSDGSHFQSNLVSKGTQSELPVGMMSNRYFKFEVKGIYSEVPGCTTMNGGELTITVEESTKGDRPDYREYTYGSHEYGDLTLTVQTAPGMVKLQEWADKAMKVGGSGNALRRDCSLYLLARDKSTVLRTINFFGCYPVNESTTTIQSTKGKQQSFTHFTLNVDRIEETKG